ncbi:MAG: hypothetical protein MHM6MM_006047 [Cercozoa sp. M6MM]
MPNLVAIKCEPQLIFEECEDERWAEYLPWFYGSALVLHIVGLVPYLYSLFREYQNDGFRALLRTRVVDQIRYGVILYSTAAIVHHSSLITQKQHFPIWLVQSASSVFAVCVVSTLMLILRFWAGLVHAVKSLDTTSRKRLTVLFWLFVAILALTCLVTDVVSFSCPECRYTAMRLKHGLCGVACGSVALGYFLFARRIMSDVRSFSMPVSRMSSQYTADSTVAGSVVSGTKSAATSEKEYKLQVIQRVFYAIGLWWPSCMLACSASGWMIPWLNKSPIWFMLVFGSVQLGGFLAGFFIYPLVHRSRGRRTGYTTSATGTRTRGSTQKSVAGDTHVSRTRTQNTSTGSFAEQDREVELQEQEHVMP